MAADQSAPLCVVKIKNFASPRKSFAPFGQVKMDTAQVVITPSGLSLKAAGQALAADMPLPMAAPVGKGKAPIGKGKGKGPPPPVITKG